MSLNTSLFDIFFRSFVFSIRFFFLLLYFITLQMKEELEEGKNTIANRKKMGKNRVMNWFAASARLTASEHICVSLSIASSHPYR